MTREERKLAFLAEEQKQIKKLDNKLICKEEKNWFRNTHVWKDYRKTFEFDGVKKFKNGKEKPIRALDPVTKNPLAKRFNLHHMDLNPKHYTHLVRENFLAVNSETHDTIHWLYTQYCKDPKSLDRIIAIIKTMYELNDGKDVKDFKQ